MKKDISLSFTKIMYFLFAVGTIILLLMSYTGIGSSIAFKFGIGYLILTFFLLLYIPVITILNLRKLKWVEIRKRLFKFIVLFTLFGTINYISGYVLRPSDIDLLRVFSGPLGLAFGISFIDVTFLKKKQD
ncbi:hypothetical protein [Tepidibacter aestuarii]|uniref:hypothetical protein n=1 Tax=Tepidibacter aestuarii TaxID=2925782 RepID=UPI0020C10EEB|nr:hypothetical protein [Tepidibacter aestuarii]CAH2214702.1 conserved membrane protein of unknown function [Tepidibacter aestuarii]